MRTMVLALAGRPIAELARARIVPPRGGIVRRAVDDVEADVGMLEPDADQLHDVLGRDPDRQPPHVERTRPDIADPEAGHDHAVLVGIERAQRLAERLADAVAAVGPHREVGADLALARIEADGVVGRGEDHALDAGLPRRLEEIVAADDIGLQDRVPRPFDRIAAEMDDAVRALHGRRDLVGLGEVGGDEGLARQQVLGLHLVAQHQAGIERRQQRPDHGADAARGAGEDDAA